MVIYNKQENIHLYHNLNFKDIIIIIKYFLIFFKFFKKNHLIFFLEI